MLADAEGRLEFKLARARGRVTLPGKTFETSVKIPEDVFKTGQVPVPPEETIELFAFMSAADESKAQNGARVTLASVLEKAQKAG